MWYDRESMKLRTIEKVQVKNRRVLVRADFNVAIKNGVIEDDFRIKKTLPTLRFLVKNKAKVIIITHLGRPEGDGIHGDPSLSVRKIARRLSKDIGRPVKFVSECVGKKAESAVKKLKPGEILMLENLRFHAQEEKNDQAFARSLASLADVYVNEAFSVSHRAHASVDAITEFLPSYAGILLAEEVRVLHRASMKPRLPLVMVMGGAKIETKIKLIRRFFDTADNILLGGMIANHVLKAQGIAIGKSKLDPSMIEKLKGLELTSAKLHLPVDVVVATEVSARAEAKVSAAGNVEDDEIILDIGPDTIELFSHIVEKAKTIIWNGPLGFSEIRQFSSGTFEFAKAVAKSKAFTIVGGGESVAALDELGLSKKIGFISTGGGAMLDLLAGEPMPGIEALMRNTMRPKKSLSA